jgi:alkylated DNA repair protein (DNA oxidative demethylase)
LLRPGYLEPKRQREPLAAIMAVIRDAPPFTVRMSNCGGLGWVSDEGGYRYQPMHPVTGRPWPPLSDMLIAAWNDLAGYPAPPEACLINFYHPAAKMGLHQDRDEEDFDAPVVSQSLGDSCLFRVGGLKRSDPTAKNIILRYGLT